MKKTDKWNDLRLWICNTSEYNGMNESFISNVSILNKMNELEEIEKNKKNLCKHF